MTIESPYSAIAKEALKAQACAINQLAERVDGSFEKAVDMILTCKGRIIVSGMGKSGIIGKKMAATFASTGTPSFFMHPAEAFHGDLGIITGFDIVILLSYSGETEEVIRLIPSLQSFGNQIITIAGNQHSTLAKNSDVFLNVEVEREICPNNLAPTTSTLATMAMGDALAVALIQAKGFQPLDFARFHPGGSLGRKLLTRVSDVMHHNVPSVSKDASLQECLMEMTVGRVGLVAVMENEELHGVITDGDIRRGLVDQQGLVTKRAKDLMSKNPSVISDSTLIADAEKIMRDKKIKALLVKSENAGKIVGVVEIFN